MSLKINNIMPTTAKEHVAEQINSDMSTFNKKANFFLLYSAEQFDVNCKMAPEKKV
jgi:hypothetical protein